MADSEMTPFNQAAVADGGWRERWKARPRGFCVPLSRIPSSVSPTGVDARGRR
ncbi:MAG: hypothetical protein AAF224_09720 [Pseudomonadota bacterium]